VVKFYDKNADGAQNFGEMGIAGWKFTLTGGPGNITLTGFTGADGSYCFPNVAPGTYTVTEATAMQTSWFNTTAKSFQVTVGSSTVTKKFGNLCVGAGGGDGTPGFWQNKNGENKINDAPNGATPELTMLVNLCLRNGNGTDFNPKNYPDLKTWLKSATTAVNMANQLSAHLACMALNVESGIQSGTSLIYAPGTTSANAQGFATLNAVITEANSLLCSKGSIPSGDPQRAYATALKNALANGNVNTGFVQPSPCPFSF